MVARKRRLGNVGPKKEVMASSWYHNGGKAHVLAYQAAWKARDPEGFKAVNRKATKNYRENHREEIAEKRRLRAALPESKFARNARRRKQYQDDPQYAMEVRLRARIWYALKAKGAKKGKHTFELIGCSPTFLKFYIENKFKDGMNWENRSLWHLDHIKPCASFDLTDTEQQKQCFHYTNLQPLWGPDNIRKSDSIFAEAA